MVGKTNNLTYFLTKYSYSSIFVELSSRINSNQLNNIYLTDLNKRNLLIHNISTRLESLAIACSDLNVAENRDKVQNYFCYLWGKNDENAQLRGIQFDYMSCIFRDVTLASNLDFSKIGLDLSAKNLGYSPGLNTKILGYVPKIEFPQEFESVNSSSLKNAMEVTTGLIHSSVTGHKVIFTNDKPINIVNIPVIDNMPKGQVNPDIYRISPYHAIKEDFKVTTAAKLANGSYSSGLSSIGEVPIIQEKQLVSDIAKNGLRNLSKVKTDDPNSDKIALLKKMESSGDVRDSRDLLGIPRAYSNKFIDDTND